MIMTDVLPASPSKLHQNAEGRYFGELTERQALRQISELSFFCRRRHQPIRPALAKIRLARPIPRKTPAGETGGRTLDGETADCALRYAATLGQFDGLRLGPSVVGCCLLCTALSSRTVRARVAAKRATD